VTPLPTPEPDIGASLSSLRATLRTRRDILARLCHTSTEILRVLVQNPLSDVAALLEQRARECDMLGQAPPRDAVAEAGLLGIARRLADENGEHRALAASVLSLSSDCSLLVEQLTTVQAQCEEIMKAGLAATAQAMRQSAQRRRLDTAYGPAYGHTSPHFLDSQQ